MLMETVRDLTRRVRILEERYNNLRKNLQVEEQNLIGMNKKHSAEFSAINMDINDVKKAVRDIKDEISLIVKELKFTAKKEEVQVIQKYMQFWEPLDFVTRDEFERLRQKVDKAR